MKHTQQNRLRQILERRQYFSVSKIIHAMINKRTELFFQITAKEFLPAFSEPFLEKTYAKLNE